MTLPQNRTQPARLFTRPGQALSAPVVSRATGNPAPLVAPPPPSVVDLYGDGTQFSVTGTAAQAILAVPRPPAGMRRVYLLCQNNLVGTNLWFQFGSVPQAASPSIAIPANGNYELTNLNSIPQNDFWLFFPIAGTVSILFINASLAG